MRSIIILATIAAYAQLSTGLGTCTSTEFMCRDGSCIDKQYLCDGKENCPDSSDEVFSACYNTTCNGFRCIYGGCIDANLTCNNINDCRDMSDENKYMCANATTILELMTELRGSCTDKYIMQCPESKKCLRPREVCDGIDDCERGEDEDRTLCGSDNCPFDSFQCESGACIHKNKVCNLNIDCLDGSDEMPAICTKMLINDSADIAHMGTNQENSEEKPQTAIAVWQTYSCPLDLTPGMLVHHYFSLIAYKLDDEVPDQGIVEVTCNEGYILFGSNINKCVNSRWLNEWIPCTRYCEPSTYARSVVYSTQCGYKSDIVDCNEIHHKVNTELLVSCSAGFKSDSSRDQVGRHVCNENGEWIVDKANPICKPICGVNSPQHPDITPWAVSLFRRTSADAIYTFKCMGTILSPYIVITAEACFTGKEERKSPLFFKIVEGNHKIKFREDDDHGYTLHNIMEIHIITHQYNQRAALLHVVKPFIFGGLVRPVCLSPSYDETKPMEMEGVFDKDQLGEGKTEYDESMYYLTYFVASESVAYNVRSFISDIKGYISKSEQDP